MNFETLLEAAKFIELQEEQQRLQSKQLEYQPTPIRNGRNDVLHMGQHQQTHQTILKLAHPLQVQEQNIQPVPQQHMQHVTHRQLQPSTSTPQPTLLKPRDITSLTLPTNPPTRLINNSFDIINPLVIDESGEHKRKQPPIPFRTGTREVHNKLEKDRRAHLKECFDILKKQLPRTPDERKTSNLSILHAAIRHIHSLKKKEREMENEMERLARLKIQHQQNLLQLKKDLAGTDIDLAAICPEMVGSFQDVEIKIEPEEIVPPLDKLPLPRVSSCQPQLNGIKDEIKLDPDETTTYPEKLPLSRVSYCPPKINGFKEGTQVQTTALSMLPVSYPMSQVVVQKVPVTKNLCHGDLPLVTNPATVAHFLIPQQYNGKVVNVMNAQYVVKPVVVVSTPSRPS